MKMDLKQVHYTAGLANLHLTPEEAERMARDMGAVLEHMDKLSQLDTTGVEPMSQVLFAAEPTATLREDVVLPEHVFTTEEALANAPQSGSGHFKVPRVIER
jgi:aspartyl-tRNA(Asn)/glutamyl-tRNA(Gln) amidotransferase subunit C